MTDDINDTCSICLNRKFDLEIITLSACNHVVCRGCFFEKMDSERTFRCPCDTSQSTNVIIRSRRNSIRTAMSYCNYKSIVCVNSLDDHVADKITEECFKVKIRMKSLQVFKEIKYEFLRDLNTLFEYKYPVDRSVKLLLKEYEMKICKQWELDDYSPKSVDIYWKARQIINNLSCECPSNESACLVKKIHLTSKLSQFLHNLDLDYFFLTLNPFQFTARYSYTRFYGQPFFKHYFERYEEDIIQFQKVMHFPTALLLSQTVNNKSCYRKLYPFMFKDQGEKCLVCLNELLLSRYGRIDRCCHKICEACIIKYLITKAKCPIDGDRKENIVFGDQETPAIEYLKNQPRLFSEPFDKLEEIIFNTVKHIHNIIPKAEMIWMNVTKLFHLADQIQRPRIKYHFESVCYGKRVDELLSVIEALCYSAVNDHAFFESSSYSVYYSGFCKKCVYISLYNDGYLSDPSDYQRMEEEIHLYTFLHRFSESIYNNFVNDIIRTFQHFEKTDKILYDMRGHFDVDRPSHISLRQLRKDMPMLLSQQKFVDALKAVKQSLKKTKYLNHLCTSMMWY